MQNNHFLCIFLKSGHIAISRQPNNRYYKLCVIPVIDNYWIFLTIKLLTPQKFSWFIHVSLRITKNYTHQDLTAVHQGLMFPSSHLISTSALPQKICLGIFYYCDSLYPCTPCILRVHSNAPQSLSQVLHPNPHKKGRESSTYDDYQQRLQDTDCVLWVSRSWLDNVPCILRCQRQCPTDESNTR